MICVGIDVAKDKHDCFILNSEGAVLADVFTIANNLEGFNTLLDKLRACSTPQDSIKVGLEATEHYSYNILGFLLDRGLPTYVLNPLRTNLYRKSLSLRKTKTDRVDARTFAAMLMSCCTTQSDAGLKPYTDTAYHNKELKSLTIYRFDKVKEQAKLKTSVSRLVCILFAELEKLVTTLHTASVYALLSEFPGAKQIADAHLTRLKTLLADASKGRYGRDMAVEIRDAARGSIGSRMPAKSLELQHTIRLIRELDAEIEEIEAAIQAIMEELRSPITTIPGIGYRMGAMILAEVGDFSRFDSPDKLLAYAGMSPSTYQSGQLKNCYPHMEKRGSRYLRYALYNAAKYVCHWDPGFAAYLVKKRAEGKHYNIALSHAAKKLVRLIFALEKSRQPYCPAV
ncbi:IS110 family transposase [Acutalibacter intestini]|uniref:IS110 family transposase n=1 Tax=Acutalibacter intestini TaxID=3093659 RepID=UPI002AC8B782|nr:IS110 family transposase [Acutalibacter sp. M00204]